MLPKDITPGVSKRPGKDLNEHFVSSTVQAWPHSDIYDKDKMCIEFEELSARAAKQYEVDYGSTKNAQISHQYGRATGVPRKITGIEQRNGYATAIIHTRLFKNTDTHRRNMCRILAIYFAEGEFGSRYSNMKISAKDKRLGFMQGVWLLDEER